MAATGLTSPPVAKREEQIIPIGGNDSQVRGPNPMQKAKYVVDPYYWIRDDARKDERVLQYLKDENAYTEANTSHLKPLVDAVEGEILSHIQESDDSVPYRHGEYLYYHRMEKGRSYRIYCRKLDRKDSVQQEEVILDVNAIAKEKSYCDVHNICMSPDHSTMAYAADYFGYEDFNVYLRSLSKNTSTVGEPSADALILEKTTGNIQWGKDNTCIYFTTHDESHRPFQLWKKSLRPSTVEKETSEQPEAQLLWQEDDEKFTVGISKSKSGRFLFLNCSSTETSEVHYIDLDSEDHTLQMISPRKAGVLTQICHQGSFLYNLTNMDGALNFKVMRTAVEEVQRRQNFNVQQEDAGLPWEEVIAHDPNTLLDHLECFEKYLLIGGRHDGNTRLWIVDTTCDEMKLQEIAFPETIYEASSGINKIYTTNIVRVSYCSMITPRSTFDYDVESKTLSLLKETPCPNYDRSLYMMRRLEAPAQDGTYIPISLLYRKDSFSSTEANPTLMEGYGAYGCCSEPDFSSHRLSLLDRGIVYAIAHVRGGSEKGRAWYEKEGKYLNKKNSFTDFIDCATFLIEEGVTSPKRLAITGASAGGLLMGAVLNMRPDLFAVCVAGVPFVDVLVTLSDASIPLTTGEWEEWGNPNEEQYFEYIKSYSPIDNVTAQEYPDLLVLAGLYDPRVGYWEPAKWVAKLRQNKTDNNLLILKTDLDSGHFSASDRYKFYKELSFEYAFIIDRLGLSSRILPVAP